MGQPYTETTFGQVQISVNFIFLALEDEYTHLYTREKELYSNTSILWIIIPFDLRQRSKGERMQIHEESYGYGIAIKHCLFGPLLQSLC